MAGRRCCEASSGHTLTGGVTLFGAELWTQTESILTETCGAVSVHVLGCAVVMCNDLEDVHLP